MLVQAPEDVIELVEGFAGTPRSTFRESVDGHAFEGIEEAQAPADIAGLLTQAPIAIDELIRQSGESAAAVQLALLELELAGKLVRHAGARVSLA